MHDIYSDGGQLLASIPLSDGNLKLLGAGVEASIQYHTPKALQGTLGTKAGRFDLYKEGDQIRTRNVAQVKEYAGIQAAYRASVGQ